MIATVDMTANLVGVAVLLLALAFVVWGSCRGATSSRSPFDLAVLGFAFTIGDSIAWFTVHIIVEPAARISWSNFLSDLCSFLLLGAIGGLFVASVLGITSASALRRDRLARPSQFPTNAEPAAAPARDGE